MEFILASFGVVALIVLALVLVARGYPGSGADLLQPRPARSPQDEAELEAEDLRQLLAAQNAFRRKRGAAELTEADAHRMASEDEAIRDRARQAQDRALEARLREGDD